MKSLLDRDLVKGNILDVIREYRERLEILERLAKESTGGEGSLAVAEGPDIDLVYSGGTAVVGRGGDTILLFDSGGAPVAEFAFTAAGLTAALAAAGSGDVVQLPAGTLDVSNVEFVIPAGVTVKGIDRQRTIIGGAITQSVYLLDTITMGLRSVIENLTISVTITAGAEYGHYWAISSAGGIIHDIDISITGDDIQDIRGISGWFYGEDINEGANESLYNVSINISIVQDDTFPFDYIDAWGVYINDNSAETQFVHNVDINILLSTPRDDVRLWGCCITIGISGGEFRDLYGYISITAPATNTVNVGANGLEVESSGLARFYNCTFVTSSDRPGKAAGTDWQYGIYTNTDYIELYNCIGISRWVNAGTPDDYYSVGIYAAYDTNVLFNCIGISEASGLDGSYGLESSDVVLVVGGRYSGDTHDIFHDFSDKILAYGVQYDSFSGMPTYLPGDRRSLNIPSTKTTTYGIAQDNEVVLCNATGGAFSVTLPAAAGCVGWIETVKKIDASANAVTVDPDASETIDGATTYSLAAQYNSVTIVCDGSTWWVI